MYRRVSDEGAEQRGERMEKRRWERGVTLGGLILVCGGLLGCSPWMGSTSRHAEEDRIHAIRTDFEDVKHDLNTYEIEHHVLEGKVVDIEQTVAAVKQLIMEMNSGRLSRLTDEMQQLEDRLTHLKEQVDKYVSDIHKLSAHANTTTTALAHYKGRFAHLDKMLQTQIDQLNKVLEIQETPGMGSLLKGTQIYVVEAGDSLEKIAHRYHTTVDVLKKNNGLTNDLIIPGQKLKIYQENN